MQQHIQRIRGLIREILAEEYLALRVDRYVFEEQVRTHEGRIHCELHHERSGEPEVIEGTGVGIIDAFFHGLRRHLAKSYPSLDSIQFVSFAVRGDMDSRRQSAGSDAEGDVILGVRNTAGATFEFSHSSRSLSGSAVEVTLQAVEYFVNSERAFSQSYKALRDAKARGRQDLVDVYTSHLSELVRNTSYSEVIEDIQKQLTDEV